MSIWNKAEAGQYDTLVGATRITVWRREPGCWTFEANGVPADRNYGTVAQAKAASLAWASANLTDGAQHPVVIVDMYLGRRNVAFLANSSERTTALWTEKQARRAQFLAAREAVEKPVTTAQEYRGVVITTLKVSGNTMGDWFIAQAGGRSPITRSFTTAAAARDAAINAIDDAYVAQPEKIALWMNDTTHWRASQDHTLPADEMLRRCRAEGGAEAVRQEAARMEREARATVDLTPTWASVTNALIAVLENGTEEGKAAARMELHRMAKAADMAVAQQKKEG